MTELIGPTTFVAISGGREHAASCGRCLMPFACPSGRSCATLVICQAAANSCSSGYLYTARSDQTMGAWADDGRGSGSPAQPGAGPRSDALSRRRQGVSGGPRRPPEARSDLAVALAQWQSIGLWRRCTGPVWHSVSTTCSSARSSGSRRIASACLGTLMPAPACCRTIRARTRRSLDVRAARLVRMTLAGMFA